ncbi:hypothetical protein A374_15648 [Fictibacillus macauensis ZFHKF-1]|uniref:Lipoprotein n=1 Tax=Fictibacillus macauensis ZFHKF-1 TaxID=1196324 RepID=I8AFS6_9BACL|nr:hypothetical protein [Fictibacillus macauensis]EIT84234.1 hypothetical protein A374_15648 [Fictibacillus macauensis ZFHKF-1]
MRYIKYFFLTGGIITIILSCIALYFSLTPQVGAIGNGPNYTKIWTDFTIQFLIGLFLVAYSIYFIKKND